MIMETQKEVVYRFLKNLEIDYTSTDHPPVFTVEEANEYWQNIKGMHCKNLFLRNNKGRRHFLLVAAADILVDLKTLGGRLGERLGFASAERLMKYLGLTPGSVSPFGLINDIENQVEVMVDDTLRHADYVNFHPNINTTTLTITSSDFEKYLDHIGNKWEFVNLKGS